MNLILDILLSCGADKYIQKKIDQITLKAIKELEIFKDNILFNNPKAVLTPHIAASTTEASIVVAEMVANQISNFLLNGKKINTV